MRKRDHSLLCGKSVESVESCHSCCTEKWGEGFVKIER